jgi:hypothetical protein
MVKRLHLLTLEEIAARDFNRPFSVFPVSSVVKSVIADVLVLSYRR